MDAVIVGAGFAGMYMLHRLRGLGLSAQVFEAGGGVGGTWYWNRYPGARCDVESLQYSYSFDDALQQEWRWGERYAPQPEILRYAEHVADCFDLKRDIAFDTRVEGATFDEAGAAWDVRVAGGRRARARHLILAVGCLSAARAPDIPGRETFAGATYHTGEWPHEGVDFTGLRVAVIGTGSSGMQAIPAIARQAREVTVFQRTAHYAVPAHNRKLDDAADRAWKAEYPAHRARARRTRNGILLDFADRAALETAAGERDREYAARWDEGGFTFMGAFRDLVLDEDANATAADFVRARIRAQVRDPQVAARLAPTTYPIGTKRLCVEIGYFDAFNRDNVTLVDLRETPIAGIEPAGIRTSAGLHEVDAIVFATGFDAMTGPLTRMDLRGTDGTLAERWAEGPRTHLGLMSAGFPNMFMITGPGSPSVLSNMMVSIEQHVDFVADCLAWLRARGIARIEPSAQAERDWMAHVQEAGARTLYPRAASWYMGANVPGKPRVFMPYIGGVGAYRDICDDIAARGYPGFRLDGRDTAA